MVQTFPMPLEDFFENLPIQVFTPDLTEALEVSRNGGGEVLTADLGPRLWKNDIVIRSGYYGEIEQIKARLNMLRYAGRSLMVHGMPFLGPQYDPDGSILAASTITLTDVQSNNRVIELSGFPNDYTLTVGDFIGFTYGSNPIRYAFHQCVETVSEVAGVITIEVCDFIRPGFALDSEVTLIRPEYKAIVLPGSTVVPPSEGQRTEGLKFSVMQTLR